MDHFRVLGNMKASLLLFAQLAGPPKDQIKRKMKACKRLDIIMRNWGHCFPDWHIGEVMKPHAALSDRASIETVTRSSLGRVLQIITSGRQSPHSLGNNLPPFSGHVRQSGQPQVDHPAVLEEAQC